MLILDPIGDLITRIRNGQKALKDVVQVPASKEREAVLKVLVEDGYLSGFVKEKTESGHDVFSIKLKYYNGRGVIQCIKRVSKPGRRVYSSVHKLKLVNNGLGINILSTSKGVMSDVAAKQQQIGGEVLCSVF